MRGGKCVFTAIVQDHVHRPRNAGALPEATHHGVAGTPGEGPYMLLWFEVAEETIVRASYATYGCPSAIASGSVTAEILQGRTIAQALLLDANDIQALLGGLPEGKGHCAQLVVDSVKDAFCARS